VHFGSVVEHEFIALATKWNTEASKAGAALRAAQNLRFGNDVGGSDNFGGQENSAGCTGQRFGRRHNLEIENCA
jgi:hypothetical protein